MYTATKRPQHFRQRGAALMVMLVIMVVGAATFLVSSFSNFGLQIVRDQHTAIALAQARDALIGHAVTYTDYPLGNLPCPDTDDDGTADAGGSDNCPQYIGRLPWKTLGLPDLRDSAGERLWYTLSRNVRRYALVRPINSDTNGTLNVTGTKAENNLIAIVFAPGSNVDSQSRSGAQSVLCTTTGTTILENRCAANYLEGSNDDPSPGSAPNVNYQNANTGVTFNDQIVTVSRDQIFSAVEKRVGHEIKNVLNTYYTAWGAYPFAAPFSNPSTSSFTGQASPAIYYGLLPIGDIIIPNWASIPVVTFSGSGSYSSCELRDGSATDSRWRCYDISISPGEIITITGTLNHVGLGLWRPHHIGNICEVRARDSSDTRVLTTSVLDNVSVSGSLNSDGSATIVFQAQGKSGFGTLKRIELRDILDYTTDIRTNTNTSDCSPTPTSPVIPTWLFDDATKGNNWHQFAYYSIANEFAPGGDHTCTTSPCLTVNGQGGGGNIHAVVVMTGSALNGVTFPSASLADYLEGENATPSDYIFQNGNRSSAFNDQVIGIAQ